MEKSQNPQISHVSSYTAAYEAPLACAEAPFLPLSSWFVACPLTVYSGDVFVKHLSVRYFLVIGDTQGIKQTNSSSIYISGTTLYFCALI